MRRIFSRKAWRDFLTRGNCLFIALGGIYVFSPRATQSISQELSSHMPQFPKGQAFVRWGLRPASSFQPDILIAGIGRLGNSIVQVINSIILARHLGSRVILYPLFAAIDNSDVVLGDRLSLHRMPLLPARAFSSPHVLWRTHAMTPAGVLAPPDGDDFERVQTLMGPALGFLSEWRTTETRTDVLTIYLRSGDIFAGPSEPDYGQPPWAFYKKVLHFQDWSEVQVVAEDSANPNFSLIRSWCKQRNIPFSHHGETLNGAVTHVVRARNLVTARGTFVPSLVFLSRGKRNVFQFHDDPNPLMAIPEVSVYRVLDVRGDYVGEVMSGNWRNTEHQLSLMVNYPDDAVSEIVDPPQ